MKRMIYAILIILLILPTITLAAGPHSVEFGDYETAQKIIKETMKAYYIKGPKFQYNFAKAQYGVTTPEEATSQDMKYFVCAAFTYTTYTEAFGTIYNKTNNLFPRYNYDIANAAGDYYRANKNNESALDGNYLVYYENTTEDKKAKYIYNDATSFDDFINIIRPGDLVVYKDEEGGHALIVYDIVTNPTTNKKDAIILNSTADEYIRTRIASTSKLSHNFFKSPNGTDGKNWTLDIPQEGTIQWLWLSKLSKIVNSNEITCSQDECAFLRIFYEKDGKAIFNYKPTQKNLDKSKLRLQYPGLSIEKTIDKGDNNSVHLEDELTYKIKITNNSNVSYDGKKYDKFYIEETLSDYVSYISSDGTRNNNKITWEINGLDKDKSIELTYKVKVNKNYSNINQVIKSEGKFYNQSIDTYITTGTIENKIIPKVTNQQKTYQECFNSIGDISGLEMLDKVYSCVYNDIDLEFDKFQFEDIFTKPTGIEGVTKSTEHLVYPKDTNNKYYKMILNNYWSGIYKFSANTFYLPRWSGTDTKNRARTIVSSDFKDGDILIYSMNSNDVPNDLRRTYENGIYAFIYINGKFIRKNISSQSDRVEFSHEYYNSNIDKFPNINNTTCSKYGYGVDASCNYFYNLYGGTSKLTADNKEEILSFVNYQTLFDKDYYVILRPEQIIKQANTIEVDTTTLPKTTYNQNEETLNITGAKLNIIYNDGTKEQVSLENTSVKITGFDTSKVGQNNIVIEYNGFTTTIALNVVEPNSTEQPKEETPKEEIKKEENNPNTGSFVSYIMLLIVGILSTYIYTNIKKKEKIIKL